MRIVWKPPSGELVLTGTDKRFSAVAFIPRLQT